MANGKEIVSRTHKEDLDFYGNKITSVKEGGSVIGRIDYSGEMEEMRNHLVDVFLENCDKHLNWRCNKMEGMDAYRFSHHNLATNWAWGMRERI